MSRVSEKVFTHRFFHSALSAPKIQQLTRALEEEVEKRAVTRRLMTHPGVGPLTALAFELVIGTPERKTLDSGASNFLFLFTHTSLARL